MKTEEKKNNLFMMGHFSTCYPPFSVNNFLQPPRHGLLRALQVLDVIHLEGPQLQNFPLPLIQVLGTGIPQLLLHPCPHILDWVQVRAIAWPFNELMVGQSANHL